jgi:tellurite resistance protein TehA-like permease
MNSPPREDKPSFLEDFFPGYFALVMATGIVSLAMHFEDFPLLPGVLLWLNVIFYAFEDRTFQLYFWTAKASFPTRAHWLTFVSGVLRYLLSLCHTGAKGGIVNGEFEYKSPLLLRRFALRIGASLHGS